MATSRPILADAVRNLQAGNLDLAEKGLREILETDPNQPDALNLLGLLVQRRGRPDLAVGFLQRAIRAHPTSPYYHNNLGEAFRAGGHIDEALACYHEAIQLKPDYFEALNNLGIVLQAKGRLAEAANSYEQAIRIEPGCAPAHFNLGTLRQREGNRIEAKTHFRRARDLEPRSADVRLALARILAEDGELDAAVEELQTAASLDSRNNAVPIRLAALLAQLGRRPEAQRWLQAVLEQQPRSVVAHNNLGILFFEQGNLAEAQRHFHAALAIDPRYAESHLNLGKVLQEQGNLEEAKRSYRQAIALQPNSAVALYNLGTLWQAEGNRDQAVASFRQALAADPRYAEALLNLGVLLQEDEHLEEARDCYERALSIRPDLETARRNLSFLRFQLGDFEGAAALLGAFLTSDSRDVEAWSLRAQVTIKLGDVSTAHHCFTALARIEPQHELWGLQAESLCPTVFLDSAAIDRYREDLTARLDDAISRGVRLSPKALVNIGCRPSFNLQFHGQDDRPIKERFGRLFQPCFPIEEPVPRTGRLRAGFVVTSDQEELFARLCAGVLDHFDTGELDVTVACTNRGEEKLRRWAPHRRCDYLRLAGYEKSVAAIRAARFDVLYHWIVGPETLGYFLPFARLAPVQCTSLGIQVTSGIPAMDHYVSSELIEPEGAQTHYSESLVMLGTLPAYVGRLRRPAQPRARDWYGLRESEHVYLCPQQLGKFHPDFDAILGAILGADPAGVLVLLQGHEPFSLGRLKERFQRRLPDLGSRIRYLPHQSADDYRSLILGADVLLDPIHFGGVNTTYDAFSLGKAVITLPGPFQRSRYTYGCYRKMKVLDCVARSAEHYVELAVAVASDPDLRHAIESKILEASEVLFNDPESARGLEQFLIEAAAGSRRCGSG